jgi:hypothetical protein
LVKDKRHEDVVSRDASLAEEEGLDGREMSSGRPNKVE